ncbi:MAG: SAM-dependent methyltransferase [Anaerolineaceae bacterium]|nr:SAM-dependent methyltransferase [Anaerolineaceae bacterium]
MAEKQAGITALVTAYARAYHATHDSPKIFDDFLADQYYTAQEHIDFDRYLAETLKLIDPALASSQPDQDSALALVMQIQNGPVTLSRSRYAEDSLEDVLRQDSRFSPRQYVLLGAGFDTFAFRRSDLLERLQVFEVDHPVTQELKRQRIGAANWKIPGQLHFVPVDFTAENLTAALKRSSYHPDQPSFFSWLGVSYYLTSQVVFAALQDLAGIAAPGSTIVFDYLDTDAFVPEKAGKRVQFMLWIADQVGEPMKSGFDPHHLADELDVLGWKLQEDLAPDEINRRYFQGRSDLYRAFEHLHFARAVIG